MTQHRPTIDHPTSSLPHWLALALAIGIIAIGGALYGSYSQRWGPPPDLTAAGARVAELPHEIGNWRMVAEEPIGESALEMLECAGSINRTYVDQETGRSIGMAILVGPVGPIAVHTPEICYSSRAYDLQGERSVVSLPGANQRENHFWTVDFKTQNPLAESLRVYYGWSTGGPWMASANPRFELASAPYLYKLQLATPVVPGSDTDAGSEFLKALAQSGWQLSIN